MIKDAWTSLWEAHKLQATKDGAWAEVSGAIKNPGKTFFLKLASEAVRRVNAMRYASGLIYARNEGIGVRAIELE
jgi:hypothetical protein